MMTLAETAITLLAAIDASEDDTVRAVHSRLLNELLRHAPGPVHVSRAAQHEADRRALGDLRQYSWRRRPRAGGAVDKATFAWDHFYPVAELRRQLEALCARTKRHVERILRQASVAWILKTEDAKLNQLGYRHRRADPYAAYSAAGIMLVAL